jgi:hypothetical protein
MSADRSQVDDSAYAYLAEILKRGAFAVFATQQSRSRVAVGGFDGSRKDRYSVAFEWTAVDVPPVLVVRDKISWETVCTSCPDNPLDVDHESCTLIDMAELKGYLRWAAQQRQQGGQRRG